MNIVSNAVDSLHERGGVISITSRTVSTDDSEPDIVEEKETWKNWDDG